LQIQYQGKVKREGEVLEKRKDILNEKQAAYGKIRKRK
jgi:hypothetical protein